MKPLFQFIKHGRYEEWTDCVFNERVRQAIDTVDRALPDYARCLEVVGRHGSVVFVVDCGGIWETIFSVERALSLPREDRTRNARRDDPTVYRVAIQTNGLVGRRRTVVEAAMVKLTANRVIEFVGQWRDISLAHLVQMKAAGGLDYVEELRNTDWTKVKRFVDT